MAVGAVAAAPAVVAALAVAASVVSSLRNWVAVEACCSVQRSAAVRLALRLSAALAFEPEYSLRTA